MTLSRTQLHNKIKALTGKSTSIYIRSIRLQKAAILLKTTELRISEVAFGVGFKDPDYFTRTFIQAYDMSPIDFKEQ